MSLEEENLKIFPLDRELHFRSRTKKGHPPSPCGTTPMNTRLRRTFSPKDALGMIVSISQLIHLRRLQEINSLAESQINILVKHIAVAHSGRPESKMVRQEGRLNGDVPEMP